MKKQTETKQLASIDRLIEIKSNIEIKDTVEYDSKELGGIVEIKKIPRTKYTGILGLANKGTSEEEIQNRLLYECIPFLHDKKLQEAFNVKVPYDIAGKVFSDNLYEIGEILSIISDFYGYKKEVVDALKKQ